MKKYLFLLSFICSACLFGANLLVNSGFEDVKDGKPVNWNQNKPKNFENVEFKLANGMNGKYSGQIVSNNPATQAKHFLAYIQNINIAKLEPYTPGKEVMLSFDYSTDAPGTRVRAYVEGVAMGKGFNFFTKTLSNYVGWAKGQVRFKLPAQKPQRLYVVLQLLTSGRVSFDNVVIDTNPPPVSATPQAKIVKTVKAPELDLRFCSFPMHNTFIKGETPLEIAFNIPMQEDKFTEVIAEIVNNANSKTVYRKRFDSFGNRVKGKIPVSTLASGVYRLKFKALVRKKEVEESVLFRVVSADEAAKFAVKFRKDGIMLFHGKPYFPILVCPPFTTQEAFTAYQQAGFNGITPQINASGSAALAKSFYKKCAQYGLNVVEWINFADTAGRSDAALSAHAARSIANMQNIPNFIGWMNDEDAWRGISVSKAKRAYEAFFANAPGYVMWVNQAPRGTVDYLRKYVRYSDITGADVYPIPAAVKHSEKPRKNIACLGDYTDDFFEAGDFSKPVWMILQAWSWGGKKGSPDKPFPTYDELRFMFYNSILHGATGIAWFDNNTLAPQNKVMVHLGNINHEFHAIEDFILNGSRTADFELIGSADGIKILERTLNGEKLLIITNENDTPRTVKLTNKANVKLFDTQKKQNLNGSTLTAEMDKFGVLILSSKKISYKYPASYIPMVKNTASALPLTEAVAAKKAVPTLWKGSWIWNYPMADKQSYSEDDAVKKFTVNGKIDSAWLCAAVDNEAVIYLNDKEIERITGWKNVSPIDLKPFLKQGENTLRIHVVNYNSFGGVIFEGQIKDSKGTQHIFSDANTVFKKGKTYVYGPAPLSPWKAINLMP